MAEIRVELPAHLRVLAGITSHEVRLEVAAPTMAALLDALEAAYPMLSGTVRVHATGQRQPYLRFFAGQRDLSLDSLELPLPAAVVEGREPVIILGAVAGG